MTDNIINFPGASVKKENDAKPSLAYFMGTPGPMAKNFPLTMQVHILHNQAFSMIMDNQLVPPEIKEMMVGSFPGHLVDVVEELFRGVLIPPDECVAAFTVLESNSERLRLEVKLAKTEEFNKSFANVVPYFSVTVNVEDEKTYPVDYDGVLYPILTGVEDGIGEEFDNIAVREGSFSPASHEKVIMNAITFMKNNSIAENKVDVETGMLMEGEGSYIELRVPFGFEKMITIYITYNGTM